MEIAARAGLGLLGLRPQGFRPTGRVALMLQVVRSGARRSPGTQLSLRGTALEVQITMAPSCSPLPTGEAW
ncbi:hypothetical protein [Cyanobium sp. CH-040]|uniref:hypothetical protein n=1 Tax=Cyanobium sp. CH-040 TaxID=2823708 RepID=UPI0020CD6043|nr:hypothetical protein [Cyanobium sp. CH-040]